MCLLVHCLRVPRSVAGRVQRVVLHFVGLQWAHVLADLQYQAVYITMSGYVLAQLRASTTAQHVRSAIRRGIQHPALHAREHVFDNYVPLALRAQSLLMLLLGISQSTRGCECSFNGTAACSQSTIGCEPIVVWRPLMIVSRGFRQKGRALKKPCLTSCLSAE